MGNCLALIEILISIHFKMKLLLLCSSFLLAFATFFTFCEGKLFIYQTIDMLSMYLLDICHNWLQFSIFIIVHFKKLHLDLLKKLESHCIIKVYSEYILKVVVKWLCKYSFFIIKQKKFWKALKLISSCKSRLSATALNFITIF